MIQTKLIPDDTLIVCPWCDKESSALSWNELSKTFCVNREMRKLYIPIFNTKVFSRNSESFYKCPKCGSWTRGNQLYIRNTDKLELKKLGHLPLIAEVKDDEE